MFLLRGCVTGKGYLEKSYMVPQERVWNESYLERESPMDVSASLGVDNDMILQKIVEWYLSLRGSPTYQVDLLGWTLLLGLCTYHWCFH